MKIIPIGCGSAMCLENFQSNFVIEHNGKRFLLDAGDDIRFALKAAGLKMSDIDAVYVSHLHGDHANGVQQLGFGTYFNPATNRSIKLIGNEKVIEDGWNHTWSGAMRTLEGVNCSLDSYFKVERLPVNGMFLWNGITFQTVQTVHVMDEYGIVPSFGLIMSSPESTKKVYFTTDTQFCPHQIQKFYDQVDVIIQDCETVPDQFASKVHSHFKFLKTLDEKTKAKMYLTHYNDNCSLDWERCNQEAKDNGFLGFLKQREAIEI